VGILLVVMGVLLLLFGGGCTFLWFVTTFGSGELSGFHVEFLVLWVVLGLGPLVVGVICVRAGRRINAGKDPTTPIHFD
jgi:hypothetical protein